jgi:hypothetical protein
MTPEQRAMQDKREALREIEERASAEPPRSLRLDGPVGCLAILAGAAAGVVAGAYIGSAWAPAPDPTTMLDLSGLDGAVVGAIVGLFVGPIVAVVLAYLLWSRLRHG